MGPHQVEVTPRLKKKKGAVDDGLAWEAPPQQESCCQSEALNGPQTLSPAGLRFPRRRTRAQDKVLDKVQRRLGPKEIQDLLF
jgi:hypothetical protein